MYQENKNKRSFTISGKQVSCSTLVTDSPAFCKAEAVPPVDTIVYLQFKMLPLSYQKIGFKNTKIKFGSANQRKSYIHSSKETKRLNKMKAITFYQQTEIMKLPQFLKPISKKSQVLLVRQWYQRLLFGWKKKKKTAIKLKKRNFGWFL